MDTLVDCGAAEKRARLQSLPPDLQLNILRRVSEASRGYSHALVCKDWAALAPSAQLACVCTCKAAGDEGGVEAAELARELSRFPNLTSLDITARDLPDSFTQALSRFPNLTSLDITARAVPESFLSSCVPESLKDLCVQGPRAMPWDLTPLQGLPRLQSLETLCVVNHSVPSDAWPLSASLQHLDLGGLGDLVPFTRKTLGEASRPMERLRRGLAELPRGLLEGLSELRELRVFRATLLDEVRELPDSMSHLTNLEELNLWGYSLESLFPGIGQCQKLRRLIIGTSQRLTLPASLTQLSSLSLMYLSAPSGVQAPRDMDALSSLQAIEMSTRWSINEDDASALFAIPSLQRLHTTGLPRDMSMLTSLQELVLYGNPRTRCPESMWSLNSLRALILERMHQAAIPRSVRGLTSLEELQVLRCNNIKGLPDSLSELPQLKKLFQADNRKLRSLPASIGSWPSLQTLYLKDLPQLRLPKAVQSELRLLDDLTVHNCRQLRNMEA